MQSFLLIVARCVVRINELMIWNVLSSWNRRQLPAQGICKRALKCKQYTFRNLSSYVWRTNGTLKISVHFVGIFGILNEVPEFIIGHHQIQKAGCPPSPTHRYMYRCSHVRTRTQTDTNSANTTIILHPVIHPSWTSSLTVSPTSLAGCFQELSSLLHVSKFPFPFPLTIQVQALIDSLPNHWSNFLIDLSKFHISPGSGLIFSTRSSYHCSFSTFDSPLLRVKINHELTRPSAHSPHLFPSSRRGSLQIILSSPRPPGRLGSFSGGRGGSRGNTSDSESSSFAGSFFMLKVSPCPGKATQSSRPDSK